ncbi:MAG TPA: hypothetical protein VN522_11225 [Solirubrobacterales bacterium]|nr:hypothetical protein [Solirubrobacterales bacterium]
MVLALASCGGGGASSSTETITAKRSSTTVVEVETPRKVTGTGDCEKQLGEFVGRMSDLRQSLLAGLSYSEYVVRVRAIRDAYEAIPVKKLGGSCLDGPASDAEDALNQYLRAANTWGDCAGTAGCAAGEIEGKLQRRWRIASKSLDEAKQG